MSRSMRCYRLSWVFAVLLLQGCPDDAARDSAPGTTSTGGETTGETVASTTTDPELEAQILTFRSSPGAYWAENGGDLHFQEQRLTMDRLPEAAE